MTTCEVLETRSTADEWGRVCNRLSDDRCYECGIPICDQHTALCLTCKLRFCPSGSVTHLQEHAKMPQPARWGTVRKSA